MDLTEKQLFLALILEDTARIINSDEFTAYIQMDNLYMRGLPEICQDRISALKATISKWNVLVFYLKYSIDQGLLRQSLAPEC